MRQWILDRWQVYARVALLSALFLSPTVFYRPTVDVFNLVKISVLWVAALIGVALWVAWAAERGVWPPFFYLAYAAVAFLGAGGVATIFSENPALSLVGLYHRYGGLIPFALYAVIMVLIVGLYWEKPGESKEVLRALAAAGMVMTIYVLIQAAGLDWIEWRGPRGNPPRFPVGTMGNSNFAGGYLGISVPALVYVAGSARERIWQMALFAMTGLCLLALWFTQTRGGMMAAIAGMATMAIVYRDRLPRWTRITAVALAVLGALTAVMVLWHPGFDEPPGPLDEMLTFRTETFTIRTYYWGAAWRIFADNPVIGTGLETYYANYPPYRLPEDGASLGLEITDKPHNIFLEYAANAGILGIGTYLLLIGLGSWFGYRWSRKKEGEARFLMVAFLGTLMAYLGQGLVSIDVPPLAVMGWVALGGIAAIGDPKVVRRRERMLEAQASRSKYQGRKKKAQRRDDGPGVVRRGPTRWGVHAPVFVLMVLLVVIGLFPVVADASAKQAEIMKAGQAPAPAIQRELEEAARLHPFEPSYRAQLGAFHEEVSDAAEGEAEVEEQLGLALDHYESALKIQPGNIFYIVNVARIHTIRAEKLNDSNFEVADEWWRRAVEHDPTNWVIHNQYALVLNSWANEAGGDREIRRRSAEQLETVVEQRPQHLASWINLAKIYRVLGAEERAEGAIDMALQIEPENEEALAIKEDLEG